MELMQVVQTSLLDTSEKYQDFVEKFKPKKTTDDCYTPQNVYDVIADYVAERYGVERADFVRPFFPGGDYERYNYPAGCVVVDNPPFSILADIVKFYQYNSVPFFLFAPTLTILNNAYDGVTAVVCDCRITYDNGANVNTSFVTNLSPGIKAESCPELYRRVKAENDKNLKQIKKQVPKYTYPPEILTAAALARMSKYGIEFAVDEDRCEFVRKLESQKAFKKQIFGGGLLLSQKATEERMSAEKATEERATAEAKAKEYDHVWELSEGEKELSEYMDG